jgi:transposase
MSITQGGVFVSKKDLMVYRIIEDYRVGKLTRQEAALKLGVSERTVTRKAAGIRRSGLEGILHQNRGRLPSNKTRPEVKEQYLAFYRGKYSKFNFSHALEQILMHEEPVEKISYGTFLKWGREAGLGKVKRRRTSKARIIRDRMANEGLMLQMDGSPHKWNGHDTWAMISAIDDATSKIPAAKFARSETTFDCMDIIRRVIERVGIPEFILTDKAGWSARIGKRAHFSQFDRACKELGITVISTPIAQSKGRVERSFRTAQDRLVAEMDLYGVKSIADANRYLEQVWLPEWDKRFTVEARESPTRYRKLPEGTNLDEIFCLKYDRQVNRNHTVYFEGDVYRLTNPPKNLWKHMVTVHVNESGALKIFYGGMNLAFGKVKQPKRRWKVCA